jgi:hypothetical protein
VARSMGNTPLPGARLPTKRTYAHLFVFVRIYRD